MHAKYKYKYKKANPNTNTIAIENTKSNQLKTKQLYKYAVFMTQVQGYQAWNIDISIHQKINKFLDWMTIFQILDI